MHPQGKINPLNMGDSHLIVDIVRTYGRDWLYKAPCVGVEVGCCRGATSAKLLAELPTIHLIMVDPWAVADPGSDYYKTGDSCARLNIDEQLFNYRAAVGVTEHYAQRRTIYKMPSEKAAELVQDRSCAFVFLDGDHSYSAVTRDIAVWEPKVCSGGILAGHDYGHPRNARGLFGVNRAVDEYLARRSKTLLTNGSCWWVTC